MGLAIAIVFIEPTFQEDRISHLAAGAKSSLCVDAFGTYIADARWPDFQNPAATSG
jgi:hypothetical protein